MDMVERCRARLARYSFQQVNRTDIPHSSVACIVRAQPQTGGELELLFIERAANEHDLWSGHIAFPGGRMADQDRSLRHTAQRETLEETGIDLRQAELLGRLDDMVPKSVEIVVSCYVYYLNHTPAMRLNPLEVADAFWFPLPEITSPDREAEVIHTAGGTARTFPAIILDPDKPHPLWGITYRFVHNLLRILS